MSDKTPNSGPETSLPSTEQKMKRLTIDIPADLHRTLKLKAAQEGKIMAHIVRKWIEIGCS